MKPAAKSGGEKSRKGGQLPVRTIAQLGIPDPREVNDEIDKATPSYFVAAMHRKAEAIAKKSKMYQIEQKRKQRISEGRSALVLHAKVTGWHGDKKPKPTKCAVRTCWFLRDTSQEANWCHLEGRQIKERLPEILVPMAGDNPGDLIMWVQVCGFQSARPTLNILQSVFNIPQELIVLCQQPGAPLTVEAFGEGNMFMMVTVDGLATEETGGMHQEQLAVFMMRDRQIIISVHETAELDMTWQRLRDKISTSNSLLRTSFDPTYFLYAFCDAVVDGVFPIVDEFSILLANIEKEMMNSEPTPEISPTMVLCNRKLKEIRVHLFVYRELLGKMIKQDERNILTPMTRELMHSVSEHAQNNAEVIQKTIVHVKHIEGIWKTHLRQQRSRAMRTLAMGNIFFKAAAMWPIIWKVNFDGADWLISYEWSYLAFWVIEIAVCVSIVMLMRAEGLLDGLDANGASERLSSESDNGEDEPSFQMACGSCWWRVYKPEDRAEQRIAELRTERKTAELRATKLARFMNQRVPRDYSGIVKRWRWADVYVPEMEQSNVSSSPPNSKSSTPTRPLVDGDGNGTGAGTGAGVVGVNSSSQQGGFVTSTFTGGGVTGVVGGVEATFGAARGDFNDDEFANPFKRRLAPEAAMVVDADPISEEGTVDGVGESINGFQQSLAGSMEGWSQRSPASVVGSSLPVNDVPFYATVGIHRPGHVKHQQRRSKTNGALNGSARSTTSMSTMSVVDPSIAMQLLPLMSQQPQELGDGSLSMPMPTSTSMPTPMTSLNGNVNLNTSVAGSIANNGTFTTAHGSPGVSPQRAGVEARHGPGVVRMTMMESFIPEVPRPLGVGLGSTSAASHNISQSSTMKELNDPKQPQRPLQPGQWASDLLATDADVRQDARQDASNIDTSSVVDLRQRKQQPWKMRKIKRQQAHPQPLHQVLSPPGPETQRLGNFSDVSYRGDPHSLNASASNAVTNGNANASAHAPPSVSMDAPAVDHASQEMVPLSSMISNDALTVGASSRGFPLPSDGPLLTSSLHPPANMISGIPPNTVSGMVPLSVASGRGFGPQLNSGMVSDFDVPDGAFTANDHHVHHASDNVHSGMLSRPATLANLTSGMVPASTLSLPHAPATAATNDSDVTPTNHAIEAFNAAPINVNGLLNGSSISHAHIGHDEPQASYLPPLNLSKLSLGNGKRTIIDLPQPADNDAVSGGGAGDGGDVVGHVDHLGQELPREWLEPPAPTSSRKHPLRTVLGWMGRHDEEARAGQNVLQAARRRVLLKDNEIISL